MRRGNDAGSAMWLDGVFSFIVATSADGLMHSIFFFGTACNPFEDALFKIFNWNVLFCVHCAIFYNYYQSGLVVFTTGKAVFYVIGTGVFVIRLLFTAFFTPFLCTLSVSGQILITW